MRKLCEAPGAVWEPTAPSGVRPTTLDETKSRESVRTLQTMTHLPLIRERRRTAVTMLAILATLALLFVLEMQNSSPANLADMSMARIELRSICAVLTSTRSAFVWP